MMVQSLRDMRYVSIKSNRRTHTILRNCTSSIDIISNSCSVQLPLNRFNMIWCTLGIQSIYCKCRKVFDNGPQSDAST